MKYNEGQRQRMKDYFLSRPNEDIPAITLHRVGSGAGFGFCSSFSKRISEIRAEFLEFGGDLILSIDKTDEQTGQRHTWYRYMPTHESKLPTLEDIQEIVKGYQLRV